MKHTPIKRKTPLKRKTRMKQRRATRRTSERIRDTPWMLLVKCLPCCASTLDVHTPCYGAVEADHAGRRPMGRKCDDRQTIPLCSKHHRERTDFSGTFKDWSGRQMRIWLDAHLGFTQFDISRRLLELATP